ncbi:hypothetical protein J113_09865 [Mycobacterium tuberculosis CAS/NITR204]|uniref:Alanine racemase N-terminal domain-containing protein n=1 Tax=Mycobacterium tuberculosis CAS/NITR204 TaxID=1310114 RepID=R4M5I8_MYCTX|nr:hypothetical protein J113_09865 [Mycobacterium tuberculosis CAS/NITR204]
MLEVAHAVGEAGLHLVGVFTFPGHSYAPGKPGEAGEQERRALNDAANALVAVGFPISNRSVGPLPPRLDSAADGASETSPHVLGAPSNWNSGAARRRTSR